MPFKFNSINQTVEGIEEVEQRLRILLFTPRRSLAGDPNFGTEIADLIPNVQENRPRIIAEALRAISSYEAGLQVLSVNVSNEGLIELKVANVGVLQIGNS
jgi:phage baseplate assembly protein W